LVVIGIVFLVYSAVFAFFERAWCRLESTAPMAPFDSWLIKTVFTARSIPVLAMYAFWPCVMFFSEPEPEVVDDAAELTMACVVGLFVVTVLPIVGAISSVKTICAHVLIAALVVWSTGLALSENVDEASLRALVVAPFYFLFCLAGHGISKFFRMRRCGADA
jgi:hypothetical protein